MVKLSLHWYFGIIVLLLIVFYTDKSSAQFVSISCYECTNCTDPFSSSGVGTKSSCYSCYKLAVSVAYAPYTYVVRRCVPACLETYQTFGGGTVQTTCCAKDYCNTGSMIKIPMMTRLFVFVFIIYNIFKQIY
ncbi:hypothetical protein I4U23_008129 [Adineta vaga]|nr:hypothetical protein I4U23_008129 [Adineta vaga]